MAQADGWVDGTQRSLSITGLKVHYNRFEALKGIDLDVASGEFVALLGPSGCGKTTLLRAIAGFVDASQGHIRLNGYDVAGLLPRQRNIGIMFQSYALFPHMSALENVAFGLECRGMGRRQREAAAMEALEMVSLGDFADRRPRQLSGGQQQRVALARAIVIKPDLLLLDEPLGALDKQLRSQMQTELKLLQKRLGVTAVFVTHDQEEAMSMADRIVVLRGGRIEQIAPPEDLFTRPNSAWVCAFVGGGNLLTGPFEAVSDQMLRLRLDESSEIRFRGPATAADRLQLPFDKVRVEPCATSSLHILDKRFLGSTCQLHLETRSGPLVAELDAGSARDFHVGQPVRVSADEAAGRVVRGD